MSTLDVQDHLTKALALHQQGDLAAAEPIYREILAHSAEEATALSLLGTLCLQTGRDKEAADLLERAIALKPDEPGWLANLGVVLRKLERYTEGADALRRSLELKPDAPETLSNLGLVQHQLGDFLQAIESFRAAIALRPNLAGPHINLGTTYLHLELFEEAAASFRQAIALQPRHAFAHSNLGMALIRLGQPQLAEPSLRRAIELNPKSAEAHRGLAIALRDLGRMEESLEVSDRAIELGENNVEARQVQIFLENYLGKGSPEVALTKASRVGDILDRVKVRDFTNSRQADKVLRVGFVSADYRQHPVSQFFGHLLPYFDKSKIEVVLYANQDKVDHIGAKMRDDAHSWRKIYRQSDDDVATMIIADGIDVLVDLSGHTGGNRLALFGQRAAPVQATWLGYSGTTGLKSIDYIVADSSIIPPEHEKNYSETALRLPHVYLCYSPPQFSGVTASVAPAPALANGYVTFGSYNKLDKMSDATVECWAKVLLATPGSKLMLKSGPLAETGIREATIARYAAHGVGADRLVLKAPDRSFVLHFQSYGEMDIALDPFPYNGTTTTCDALWMGVPLVTLIGDRFISRVGASLVRTVGLGDLAAQTVDDYVDIARRLAADLPRLTDIRSRLRQDMMASPLGDAPRFARDLESMFRQMWQRWCDTPA